MIVVDTNVIASMFLETPHSGDAERALRRTSAWTAPLLWRSEMRNVLASLVRTGRMHGPTALQTMSAAEDLMADGEFAVPSSEVLEAAAESGCTPYDCEFAVLARLSGAPLVSLDTALVRAFPTVAVSLQDFVG